MQKLNLSTFSLVLGAVALGACSEASPVALEPEAAAFSKNQRAEVPTSPTPKRLTRVVENTNAALAEAGSAIRIEQVWLFTVGPGTHPYRRLRTGPRWAWNPVSYLLDEDDFTPQLDAADVEATLERSFETWDAVARSSIRTERTTSALGNVDILDGQVASPDDPCLHFLDLAADVWVVPGVSFEPVADIVVGGWMPGQWFTECIGDENTMGIAIWLSYGDADADNYEDLLYVEEYYNESFQWVLSGAVFAGPKVDLETVALHENGHALGLGHFGGALKLNEGWDQTGNVRMLFSPAAVMNPGYLGLERRTPLPTDEAALRTLY